MESECGQCEEIQRFEQGQDSEIFWKSPSGLWYVALNPKYSPHLGRSYMMLRRHLSTEEEHRDRFPLQSEELHEFADVERKVQRAIRAEFGQFGITRISQYLKAGAELAAHPDYDFHPVYERPFEFRGLTFGNNPPRPVLLQSYSAAPNLPPDLVREVKGMLRRHF